MFSVSVCNEVFRNKIIRGKKNTLLGFGIDFALLNLTEVQNKKLTRLYRCNSMFYILYLKICERLNQPRIKIE